MPKALARKDKIKNITEITAKIHINGCKITAVVDGTVRFQESQYF